MLKNQIFIGDIRKCTKYEMHEIFLREDSVTGTIIGHIETEDELYKKDAILIKLTSGAYVDLEKINSSFDLIKLRRNIIENDLAHNSLMMSTSPDKLNSLFVDEESLKSYYKDSVDERVSVKMLKKTQN